MRETDDSSDSAGSLGAGPGRTGLGTRRVLWTSFAVSAVLHLAVILIYPTLMQREVTDPQPFVLPVDSETPEGMVVIEVLDVVEEEDPERPEEPEELEVVAGPEVTTGVPDIGDPVGPVLVEPGPTAAERLRPDLRDARVWAPIPEERYELTLEQQLDLDLAARILQYQDSVMEAIAAADAADDWTFTDAQGRRWGVSPGAIHLGDITIPLPNFQLGASDPMRQREVMRVWDAMQRQAAQAILQDSWKERAQAIRARRDRERAARRDTIG